MSDRQFRVNLYNCVCGKPCTPGSEWRHLWHNFLDCGRKEGWRKTIHLYSLVGYRVLIRKK